MEGFPLKHGRGRKRARGRRTFRAFSQKLRSPIHRQLAKTDYKVKLESKDKHTPLHSDVGIEDERGWNWYVNLSHGIAPRSA